MYLLITLIHVHYIQVQYMIGSQLRDFLLSRVKGLSNELKKWREPEKRTDPSLKDDKGR